ncbi:MAG: TIGR03905 family TSCPD domain-containing protein [Kiritimatiellae bacterium]|nr:TIGR03905 family TSCPD domain-containing protein [Kiritimatiellia bacterium]
MKSYDVVPKGVCSKELHFELDGGRLRNVRFRGGCPGNLLAIGKLVEGKDAAEVAALLRGNDCAGRGTSCADQLARAIDAALEAEGAGEA